MEVWHVGPAADARLKSLDLERLDFGRPLEMAGADARTCTSLDAPTAAMTLFWTRSNRYFRERMIPDGWTYTNRDLILRTIHPSNEFAITATSGSGAVGREHGTVQTKNPKGPAMANIVRFNQHLYAPPPVQLTLEGIERIGTEGEFIFEADAKPTWILLYRLVGDELYSELSLPVDMHGKYVNRWLEHIILDPIPFDGPASINIDFFDGPDDEGPDVDVRRRA